jgi:hypothetical protein
MKNTNWLTGREYIFWLLVPQPQALGEPKVKGDLLQILF